MLLSYRTVSVPEQELGCLLYVLQDFLDLEFVKALDSGDVEFPAAPSVRRLLVLLSLVPPEEAAARLPGKHGDESGVRAEGRRSGAGNHPLRAEGKR